MGKKNKLFSGLIFLSVLGLTACGNQEATEKDSANTDEPSIEVAKEGFPIVEEEIELTMMAPGTGLAEWKDMPTLQEYEEMTNMTFDYITPPQDDFATRFNLTIAGGDIPDIFYAPSPDLTAALEVELGEDGILIPLNDLIDEYAPNLKQLLNDNPAIKNAITTPDGNIYALPRVDQSDTGNWPLGPLWYNGKWLDELNAEVPETLDEFYDLMIRFRDEDPNGTGENDTIPFSNAGIAHARLWLLSAFDLHQWGAEEKDGEIIYSPMTENARAYYEFMNKMYEEDLMDEEIFSQSNDAKIAKGQNNQIGLWQDWFSYFTTGETPEESLNNPMFLPLTSDLSPDRSVAGSPGLGRGTFAITSKNEYPEASMRWVDYFYSEEGYEFINNGPEGYYWEWEDGEGSQKILTDVADEEGEEYRGTISPSYNTVNPGIVTTLPALGKAGEEPDTRFGDFIRNESEEKINPYATVGLPPLYLNSEEIDEIAGISGDLSTYIEETEAKFITGQLDVSDDEVWENYLNELEKMGVDRYIEIYQGAYDRMN